MTMKEKMQNAKAKKAEKAMAKEQEAMEFNELPIAEKEEIRSMQAARRSLYICTGAVVAAMVVAGAAAIVQAKASKEAAMGSVISDAEIESISAKY